MALGGNRATLETTTSRMKPTTLWAPPVLMGIAALFTVGIDTQQSLPLRAPLAQVIPQEIVGHSGKDYAMSEVEARAAGVTDYLLRDYRTTPDSGAVSALSLYIGYYDRQLRGKTIHSPKNCLPGAGWEALASQVVEISTPLGSVTVNRYLLQKENQQALVLYWYQGRGRIQANEYLVKWDLLRDSALRQRSDEALVRIVVPIQTDEDAAFALASRMASEVIPRLNLALPN